MSYRETHGHMRSRYRSGPWRLQRGGSLRRRIGSVRFDSIRFDSQPCSLLHLAAQKGIPLSRMACHLFLLCFIL
jgi:hypothetical protein